MTPEQNPIITQKPARTGLPEPRLAKRKGLRYASEDELELRSAICEILEYAFTGLVIAGVCGEVLVARYHLSLDPTRAFWWPVLSNAEVAIGLIFEMLAGIRLKMISDELTRRAKLEAARMRLVASWRALTEKQHRGLALALRDSGVAESVKFCVVLGDNESFTFASRISIPFAAVDWKIGFRFSTYLHGTFTGICIPEPGDNWLDEMKELNRRVREAFIAAEIPFVNGWREEHSYVDDNAHITAPFAWVYVGPKPAPPHDWSFEDAPA